MKTAEQYLGNYRVVRLLGEGRSGEVYLGEHVLLTMRAAIKVMHPHVSLDERDIARFLDEARASDAPATIKLEGNHTWLYRLIRIWPPDFLPSSDQ